MCLGRLAPPPTRHRSKWVCSDSIVVVVASSQVLIAYFVPPLARVEPFPIYCTFLDNFKYI